MSVEFDNTPLVIGKAATTYGEMRANARRTQNQTDETSVLMAAAADPRLLSGAIRGLCEVVLYLVDEIESLTNHKEESNQ